LFKSAVIFHLRNLVTQEKERWAEADAPSKLLEQNTRSISGESRRFATSRVETGNDAGRSAAREFSWLRFLLCQWSNVALNLLVRQSQFTQMVCDRVDTPLVFISHAQGLHVSPNEEAQRKWLSLSSGLLLS